MKKKIIIVLSIIAVIVIGLLINKIHKENVNKKEIESGIHAVVIANDVPFYKEPKTENVKQIKTLKKSENVYILDEFTDNGIEWYKIKVDEKTNGYVRANTVLYHKEMNKEKLIATDVSEFNMGKNFENKEEFEVFLLENDISYVYIRAGGRGYGSQGNFFEDKEVETYRQACEYLGIPYGYYFLDEALSSKEIDEEVQVIKDFLNSNKGNYNVLPLALDIEKHDGKGRADDIWTDRAVLVQELIDDLEEEGIKTILYSNAQTANLYLSELDTEFWLAYYPNVSTVPDYWYSDTTQPGAENPNIIKKMIGWQFTENGVGDEIPDAVDISLFKKDFYK